MFVGDIPELMVGKSKPGYRSVIKTPRTKPFTGATTITGAALWQALVIPIEFTGVNPNDGDYFHF